MARPTIYTEALANEICARIADGETLKRICRDEHMPCTRTVHRWLAEHEEFCRSHARARLVRAQSLVDEIVEIRRKIEIGEIDPHAGRTIINSLQWQASKENTKLYGDKLEVEGRQDTAITITVRRFGEAPPRSITIAPEPAPLIGQSNDRPGEPEIF